MELLELIQIAHFDVSLKRSMIKSSLSQWMVNVSMLNGWRVKRYVQQGALQALFCFEMPSLSMSSRTYIRLWSDFWDYARFCPFWFCDLSLGKRGRCQVNRTDDCYFKSSQPRQLFSVLHCYPWFFDSVLKTSAKRAACFLWLFAQVLESSRSNLDQDLHASMSSC